MTTPTGGFFVAKNMSTEPTEWSEQDEPATFWGTPTPPPVTGGNLLLETGFTLLLEDGDNLELE